MVTPPLPDRFYKFMRRGHAQALCAVGEVRVGTLYEYRNAELYSGGVLDEGEGTLRSIDSIERASKETIRDHSLATQMLFDLSEGGEIENLAVIAGKHTLPDCFIYCVSESSDWSASSDPKYDACVEIIGEDQFFRGIGKALCLTAYGGFPLDGRLGKALYRERDYDWKEKPPPAAFVKEPKYENQREWRAVWFPRLASIQGVVFRSREVTKLVRLFATR